YLDKSVQNSFSHQTAEVGLRYLGQGTREPTPSLGAMPSSAALQQHMEQTPRLALWPALALAALALTSSETRPDLAHAPGASRPDSQLTAILTPHLQA
ncbi:MAG: hypothetical protein Q8O40_06040, partial [Chloroflexota bacterium]|nr:hypothetical protein [Chloroflexota bacterium]